MQVGDVVFYKAGIVPTWYRLLIDHTIAAWTRGPYVHVEIVTAELPAGVWQTLGSQSSGVQHSAVTPLMDKTKYIVYPLAPLNLKLDDCQEALAWANSCLGNKYGWLDIFDQVLDRLIPNNKIHIFSSGQMDCSDFVCYYLARAGVAFPKDMQQPYSVSPNKLATFCHLPP